VDAGAQVLHLHPYETTGLESLAAEACANALRAVRAACPGIPISLTTSAEIEPDPRRRLELAAGWTELPDLVTANQGEDGILELCEHLIARGVGIEAGLLSLADAETFVRAGVAGRCVRVLVEPLQAAPEEAFAEAAAMEELLFGAGVPLEQVHHGDGVASWPCPRERSRAGTASAPGSRIRRCCRTGSRPPDNAALVRAAAAMLTGRRQPGRLP